MQHPFTGLPGADLTVNVLFFARWSNFEEGGGFYVFERDGQYFILEGGHYVESEGPDWSWSPEAVTADVALARMLEWADDEERIPDVRDWF
jgi:hypothetical protein